jgi:hypothetical protein
MANEKSRFEPISCHFNSHMLSISVLGFLTLVSSNASIKASFFPEFSDNMRHTDEELF